MLFSNNQVADVVNKAFEPAWESVRPVPLVTIDFGNGRKITRTLHGNIATYVCTPAGRVVDVLPGIYTPDVFAQRLMLISMLAKGAPKDAEEFTAWMANQHRKPPAPGKRGLRDRSKTVVLELPVIAAIGRGQPAMPTSEAVVAALGSDEAVTLWESLVEDTRINDGERRLQISGFLRESGPIPPAAMTKWLYREVLDADIDDPWLGLKDLADETAFSQVSTVTQK